MALSSDATHYRWSPQTVWCSGVEFVGCSPLLPPPSPLLPPQRLTKALPGEQRNTAAEAYLHHDLLGFTGNTGNYRVSGSPCQRQWEVSLCVWGGVVCVCVGGCGVCVCMCVWCVCECLECACVCPLVSMSQDFVLRLVQSSDELVAEQMSRLLNTLSSLKTGQ